MRTGVLVIVMGSASDGPHADAIAEAAGRLGLDTVLRVASAHRTPEHALEIARQYESDPRPVVFVTVAGRSNALSGFFDPQVTSPVIACPPPSDAFGGADVWSSLRMPSGVAPLVVLEPANAALAAAKMLGLADPAAREAVLTHQRAAARRVLDADQERLDG